MSHQPDLWAQIVQYWIYQSPFSLLYFGGAVVAMRRGGPSERRTRLVLIGCVSSLVLGLAMPAAMLYLTAALSGRGGNDFLNAFGLASNVIMAFAYSFILRAAFVERASSHAQAATA
jgi:hypothetical protein